jgi:superoxide dismutase, Fe-Mn family
MGFVTFTTGETLMMQMTRREMLHKAGVGAAALALAPLGSLQAQDGGAYKLPPLPYAYDALEPSIDKETMTIHHDRHHKAYVDNLNKVIAKYPDLAKLPIDELMRNYKKVPEGPDRTAVINNGGGHANHSLFWEVMTSPKGMAKPDGGLAEAIKDTFGGLEKFQATTKALALGQFGSGWAWLVVEKGKLKAVNLPNQVTPLMAGQTPILGVDVWEHAYYLKYKNLRGDYVDAWWKVVNWPAVGKRYAAAMKG